MKKSILSIVVAMSALMSASSAAGQASTCATLRDRAQTAQRANDLDALKKLHQEAVSCDPADLDWIGRRLAQLLYNTAIASKPVDEIMLTRALDFGRNWQILATLGSIAADRRDYTAAAKRFQEALTEIADPTGTPNAPPAETILSIRRQAEEAGLLAPRYVASTRTRDGGNAGLAATQIRGISVTSVALPIQFKFDSIEFTDAGIVAADDLVSILLADRPTARDITVIGHTDAKGDASYNLQLSIRRAQAVKAYLLAHGVTAKITAEGRGESLPYQPDDPARYSEAERDQLCRRVELQRR